MSLWEMYWKRNNHCKVPDVWRHRAYNVFTHFLLGSSLFTISIYSQCSQENQSMMRLCDLIKSVTLGIYLRMSVPKSDIYRWNWSFKLLLASPLVFIPLPEVTAQAEQRMNLHYQSQCQSWQLILNLQWTSSFSAVAVWLWHYAFLYI